MSALPAISEITRIRGDNAVIPMSLVHPDTGAAFNPTDYVLLFTLKRVAGDADSAAKVQKLSTAGGFTIVTAATGSIEVELVPDDTKSLVPGQPYVADVRAQEADTGARLTVWRGRITFEFDVSRNPELSIPTVVINPDAVYLSAAQIEENREAAEAAALQAASVLESATTHIARSDNPHAVTKAQVGLSNVDNTSDLNKPISTATQAALDAKQTAATALTSWAAVTRASGFDAFATTPSSANLRALLTDKTGAGSLVFGDAPTLSTGLTLSTAAAGTGFNISGRAINFSATTPDSTYEFFTFLPILSIDPAAQTKNIYGVRALYELRHAGYNALTQNNVTWAQSGLLGELLIEKENAYSYSNRQTAVYAYLNHHGTGVLGLPISSYAVMALRSPGGATDARGFDAHMFVENLGNEHATFTPTITSLAALNMRSVSSPVGATISSLIGVNIADQTAATLLGTTGTVYGVRIGTLSAGTTAVNGSANWGIYSASSVPHYFGGPVYLVGGITGNTTLTGTLTVSSTLLVQNNLSVVRTGTADSFLNLTSDSGRSRGMRFNMGAAGRFAITVTDSVMRFTAYDDADTAIDNPITINRAAGGTVAFTRQLTTTSTLKTAAGVAWDFGAITSGAVTLDSANYVVATIGGVAVKLLKAA